MATPAVGSSLPQRDLTPRGAAALAALALAVVVALDLASDARLGLPFSVGFVLVAITIPLAVDVRSMLPAGIMPPVLMLVALLVMAWWLPDAIVVDGLAEGAGTIERVIAGFIDHAVALAVGQVAALLLVWARLRAARR